jgi:hypothetical protein
LVGQPVRAFALLIAAALAACAVLTAAYARAQPSAATPTAQPGPATVTLVQDACAATKYDAQEFASLLQIELQALGIAQLQQASRTADLDVSSTGLAVVQVHCGASADHLDVALADLATGKQLQRELVVTDLEPAARPRALSIAIALLVESAWLELATRPSQMSENSELPLSIRMALRKRLLQALEAEPLEHAARAPKREPASEARAALAVFAAGRSFPARNTGLLGIDVAYLPKLARMRLVLDLEALAGNLEVSDSVGLIANMHLYWLTAGLSLLWTSSTRPELALGPFARIGYGVANASAARPGYQPNSGGGLIAALGISTQLRAPISPNLDLWAAFDLGYVPSGVVFLIDENRTAGMAEVTLGVRLGLGFGL